MHFIFVSVMLSRPSLFIACLRILLSLLSWLSSCLQRMTLVYLADEFHLLSAVEVGQHLRSASSSILSLVVRRTRLSTIGDIAL